MLFPEDSISKGVDGLLERLILEGFDLGQDISAFLELLQVTERNGFSEVSLNKMSGQTMKSQLTFMKSLWIAIALSQSAMHSAGLPHSR